MTIWNHALKLRIIRQEIKLSCKTDLRIKRKQAAQMIFIALPVLVVVSKHQLDRTH